jgi:hypothetical protein
MKASLSLASLSAALLITGLVQAAGPVPQAAPVPAAQRAAAPLGLAELHQRLVAAGYRDITELQRKRDHFEAEARDRDGRRVELELDLSTGSVRRAESKREREGSASNGLDLGQLLARVEAAGYRAVHKIERDHERVEVSAEDANGKPVKLRLDPQTGAVTVGSR